MLSLQKMDIPSGCEVSRSLQAIVTAALQSELPEMARGSMASNEEDAQALDSMPCNTLKDDTQPCATNLAITPPKSFGHGRAHRRQNVSWYFELLCSALIVSNVVGCSCRGVGMKGRKKARRLNRTAGIAAIVHPCKIIIAIEELFGSET